MLTEVRAMIRENGIHRCLICETVIETLDQVGPELICCGRVMEEAHAKTDEFGFQAHCPMLSRTESGIRINVGSSSHAMNERHHIQWVEVLSDNQCMRQYLRPGQVPEVFFNVDAADVVVRLYCTVHGLWKRTLSAYLPDYITQQVARHSF